MNEENFLIQFVPVKHCFLQFSCNWFYKINSPKYSCLRLTRPVTKETLYFSWAPQPAYTALNDCAVGINATFAQALNFQEGDLVVISAQEDIISLHQAYLTPVTSDDYEVLELSRASVEESLLNQIRILYVSQVIVIWVSKTLNLKLTVDRLEPNLSHGRLEQLSELIIENVSKPVGASNALNRTNAITSDYETHKNESPVWGLFSHYIPKSLLGVLKLREDEVQQKAEKNKRDTSEMVFRVHPFPGLPENVKCCNGVHDENVHPFNIFVGKRTLLKQIGYSNTSFISTLRDEDHSVVLCRIDTLPKKKLKIPKKAVEESKETFSESKQLISVCVRLFRTDDSCRVFTNGTNISCVFLPKFLRRLLQVDVGSRIRLTSYKPPLNTTPSEITLVPPKKLGEKEAEVLVSQVVERVSHKGGVLVNNCCPLPLPQPNSPDLSVLVILSPGELECWPLTSSELQFCSVTVSTKEEKSLMTKSDYDKEEEKPFQKSSVFGDLLTQGITTLEYGLQLVEMEREVTADNILITGKQGSGKSRLADSICAAVAGPPHHVFVSVLQCKPLKGKKPESVGKIVTEHVEACLHHRPAVLVLEDVHCVAKAPTDDSEPSQENTHFTRLASELKDLLWKVRTSFVAVIATAESRSLIHPQLLSSRGRHTFTTFLHIPPLSKADRVKILKELLEARLPTCSELLLQDEVAVRTEGCVALDLQRLVDRVLFKACQRQAQAVEVTPGDFTAALQDFVPSDLFNVSMVRQSSHTFASVGGLNGVKQLLTEALIWPNKYPEVFSQCPLRLERGVLLYGAPGTGKSLLANAIAGESGLNFITVKGPELLSKYIGASEEAVRNVFQKAQSAQPCILFFDEFDSLAPRRGHDSTGVTDRVVNQLLTQMDGVEALEGVWVVAAASRPDLLDPALLRPGRIGNLVHCPSPDQKERLEILQTLSKKLLLSDDVDLSIIAARTNDFTGADLQAVLFTAQMMAFDALHQDSDDEEAQTSVPTVDAVMVRQLDLLDALKDTSPSLKPDDRIHFQKIYEGFQKNNGSVIEERLPEEALRVTLA